MLVGRAVWAARVCSDQYSHRQAKPSAVVTENCVRAIQRVIVLEYTTALSPMLWNANQRCAHFFPSRDQTLGLLTISGGVPARPSQSGGSRRNPVVPASSCPGRCPTARRCDRRTSRSLSGLAPHSAPQPSNATRIAHQGNPVRVGLDSTHRIAAQFDGVSEIYRWPRGAS
jgi:hypothetical protein